MGRILNQTRVQFAVRLDLVSLRNSFEKIGFCSLYLYLTLESLSSFKTV